MRTTTTEPSYQVAEWEDMNASIYRPLAGDKVNRIAIQMPYSKRNRDWLKTVMGKGTRPEWDDARKVWLVARPHYITVRTALWNRFGTITVVEDYANQSFCNKNCIEGSVYNAPWCECSCLGTKHGRGPESTDTIVGELVIHTDRTRLTKTLTPREAVA